MQKGKLNTLANAISRWSTSTAIVVTFVFVSSPLYADIDPFNSRYEVFHNNIYVAKSFRTVTRNGDKSLLFEAKTEPAGIAAWFFDINILEKSLLEINDAKLKFKEYSYSEIKDGKLNTSESFQIKKTSQKQFYNSHLKETHPVTDNLHDILGFLLAMMNKAQQGEKNITLTIAEKDNLKPYHLKYLGEEELETRDSNQQTLKFEHRSHDSRFSFIFWLSPKLNYLPVRILNRKDNGDEILMNLTHFNNKSYYFNELEETD